MSNAGVYAIARTLWDDPDFADEPYTEKQAFAWMIGAATWCEKKCRSIDGRGPITLQRAEFCHSLRFLSGKWGWSKSRVERFLKRLENRDTIRDVSRDDYRVYYITNYNRFQVVGLPTEEQERDADRDRRGTDAGQTRDKEETLKHSNIEEPSSLRSEGARKARRKTVTEPSLPDWVPQEPWQAFVEMRRKIRAPLTGKAVQLAISTLQKLQASGQDPGAVLDQSVMRAWRGLFAIGETRNDQRQSGRRESSLEQAHRIANELANEQARDESADHGEDHGAGTAIPQIGYDRRRA